MTDKLYDTEEFKFIRYRFNLTFDIVDKMRCIAFPKTSPRFIETQYIVKDEQGNEQQTEPIIHSLN
jgi:hypothetical protein